MYNAFAEILGRNRAQTGPASMHCFVNSFKLTDAETDGPVALVSGQFVPPSSVEIHEPSLLIFERVENSVKHHSFDLVWEHSSENLPEICAVRYPYD